MKKRIAARILSRTGLDRLLAALLPPEGILILNYHRIGDGRDSPYDRELWSADEAAFDAQVGCLARHCDVISPGDIDTVAGRRGRHVLVTFDDGYIDNYRAAFPILRAHGVPATFFIATGFIDHPRLPWWDEIAWRVRSTGQARLDLRPWLPEPLVLADAHEDAIHAILCAYKSLQATESAQLMDRLREATDLATPDRVDGLWMDWDMIREMGAAGMTIGGHTVDHPVLSRLPVERQCEEVEGCAARIRAETGRPMEYFAYPVGSQWAFDADTRACLEAAGVRRAFSYYGGHASAASPRFDTPRMAIERDVALPDLAAMLWLPRLFARVDPA
ncbi:polysaccharide deacetylase family protein [Luteimonas kalidii]|uniref:Polysaccharide deacetylase family protein n=1 Tax=Luteimonas kalidii TaxID=3042025 RepID=A0ABT6JTA9_9GAMM|nr:polysaccharide deacetylase family protein [Luteimonas kalidii]MDH5833919.1 polysaccharide deacetylase family protein [Luteimonas kalidii]